MENKLLSYEQISKKLEKKLIEKFKCPEDRVIPGSKLGILVVGIRMLKFLNEICKDFNVQIEVMKDVDYSTYLGEIAFIIKDNFIKDLKWEEASNKVNEIIFKQLNGGTANPDYVSLNKNEIEPKSSLTFDLSADSLEVVEILMSIETEFRISISDEEANEIEEVGQLKYWLRVRLEEKTGY